MAGHPEFAKILDEMKSLHERKSSDYGAPEDLLSNLRGSESFGVPTWVGTMIRANDKMKRIMTMARSGSLNCESVEDSLIDLANYSVLALIAFRESGKTK